MVDERTVLERLADPRYPDAPRAPAGHRQHRAVVRVEDDDRMTNPFTQQQIADITGQTSVNVNRVLADMERQGLIRRKGREIEFNDWSEMRRVASFQPAYLEI